MKMNIAIYARKSKFISQSDSIENQVQICKEYCERYFKDSNISIYSDNGFTGKNTLRPGFKDMLNSIEPNKIDYIITYKLDRLCRSVRDFVDLVELFENHNVKFTSVKENFDLDSNTGKMIALMYSMFSQIERESISERIRDNMYESAKFGRWLGGPAPLGYKFYRITESDKTITYLTIDEESCDTIKNIYTKFLEFKSLTKVKSYAYKKGIVGPRGNPLDITTIAKILRNPVYVKSSNDVVQFLKDKNMNVFGLADDIHGILTYGKNNIFSIQPVASISKHVGLIDSTSWLKVQSILVENTSKAPRKGSGKKAILSGLLKCSLCGSNMRISYKKNKTTGVEHSYYICGKKKQWGVKACNCSNLNGDFIDNIILDSIGDINCSVLINLYNSNNLHNYNLYSNDDELKLLIKNINSKESNINLLCNKLCLTDNEIVSNNIINKMESLAKEVENLKFQYDSLRDKLNCIDSTNVEDIDYSIRNFNLFIKHQSVDVQRDLLNNLIQYIVWNCNTNEININFK